MPIVLIAWPTDHLVLVNVLHEGRCQESSEQGPLCGRLRGQHDKVGVVGARQRGARGNGPRGQGGEQPSYGSMCSLHRLILAQPDDLPDGVA